MATSIRDVVIFQGTCHERSFPWTCQAIQVVTTSGLRIFRPVFASRRGSSRLLFALSRTGKAGHPPRLPGEGHRLEPELGARVLYGAFGPASENWVGKLIAFYRGETVFAGKRVPCVEVEAVDGPKIAAQPRRPALGPLGDTEKPLTLDDDPDSDDNPF